MKHARNECKLIIHEYVVCRSHHKSFEKAYCLKWILLTSSYASSMTLLAIDNLSLGHHQSQCCKQQKIDFAVMESVLFSQLDGNFIRVELLFSSLRPGKIIYLMLLLLMGVLIKCSDSLEPSFNFSFSAASFSAFFFSYSICLRFSSCARTNILTKLSNVDTTIENKKKRTKVAMVTLMWNNAFLFI